MALSLSAVEARLVAMGLGKLLLEMMDPSGLPCPVSLPFSTPGQAASLQRLLYRWLWHNPPVKARVSLRVDEAARTLTITPKASPERRGSAPRTNR